MQDDDVPIGNIPFSEMCGIVPKLLEGIFEGSQRINRIVATLKDHARKDSVNLTEKVDINKVITSAASLLESQIRKRTKAFRLDLGSDMPCIIGNAQQLEQVIINLITNALQALPDQESGINIASVFDREKRMVMIQVSDQGVGIPQNILDRIPEPFLTTKLSQGGTGLGLSISYSIVKDHRGSLKLESFPMKGTTVTVLLPAARSL
jgi:hypothetical protein